MDNTTERIAHATEKLVDGIKNKPAVIRIPALIIIIPAYSFLILLIEYVRNPAGMDEQLSYFP